MRPADSGPVHILQPTKAAGKFIWKGELDKNKPVEISSSTGTLQGDPLPGVLVFIDKTEPPDLEIVEPPSPSSGFRRLVVRSRRKIREVSISWRKASP
jgi:hypothetical protein